jgi:tetrahydromethanopterin S-methyltransferase subunit C
MIYLNLTPDQHRIMLLLHDIGFYLSILFTLAHIFAVAHPANITISPDATELKTLWIKKQNNPKQININDNQ